MTYISIFICCTFCILLFRKYKRSNAADSVIFLTIFFFLWFLPAMQYGVGTDYFNYIEIFNNSQSLDYYLIKHEYSFYYLVTLLKYFNTEPQSLFYSIGLIQTALFINFIRITFPDKSYTSIAVIFIFFFLVTNIFNNQLNVLRAYVAVLFFINSMIYKINNKYSLSLLFFLLGITWHKSIIFTIPLYFIGGHISLWIVRNSILVFFTGLLIFGSGILYQFTDTIVSNFAPMYKHYLDPEKEKNITFLQIATKLYYYPFYILFLYHLRKYNQDNLNKIDINLIALWLITINTALFIFHFGRFSRIFYYFAPFMFIPFYYLYIMKRKFITLLAIMYVFFGYFLKTVIFPSAEYKYESYLFN